MNFSTLVTDAIPVDTHSSVVPNCRRPMFTISLNGHYSSWLTQFFMVFYVLLLCWLALHHKRQKYVNISIKSLLKIRTYFFIYQKAPTFLSVYFIFYLSFLFSMSIYHTLSVGLCHQTNPKNSTPLNKCQ